MHRAPAATRVGRYLVLLVAEPIEQLLSFLLDPPRRILVGESGGRPGMENRVGLQRELVPGQMFRAECNSLPDVRHCPGRILPRQRVHEVEVDVAEARCAGGFERAHDIPGAMDAPQRVQHPVVETLCAEGQPIDAGAEIAGRIAALHGAGVRFQRYLCAVGQPELPGDPVQQPPDLVWREQARRAAPQEYADQFAAPGTGGLERQVRLEGAEIPRPRRIVTGSVGIEVTVGALAHAPGQVHVQRQRHASAVHQISCSLRASSRSALPRWLLRFFSSALNSAELQPSSGTRNSGS